MPVMFYGDPHKRWDPLIEAVTIAVERPEHVVLMGDMELDVPLRKKVAPLIDMGVRIWWIHGNHDTQTAQMWSYLFESMPEGDLNERAVTLECADGNVTVAGLGGHYRGRIWFPKEGDEAPKVESREAFMAQMGRGGRFRDGLPLDQRQTIFPDAHRNLAALHGVDILVTHEAPLSLSNKEAGFGAIDDLAQAMGVHMVIHGHHHHSYNGLTRDGIPVRGLGGAEAFSMSPNAYLPQATGCSP